MVLWEVGRLCSVACTQCQMKCLKHKTVGFSISTYKVIIHGGTINIFYTYIVYNRKGWHVFLDQI